MRNKLLIILSAFCMSSCAGTPHVQPVKTEYKVVMPEDQYFQGCKIVKLPDPKHLTNTEVAQLISDLVTVNHVCYNDIDAIHTYLLKAQKDLETKN